MAATAAAAVGEVVVADDADGNMDLDRSGVGAPSDAADTEDDDDNAAAEEGDDDEVEDDDNDDSTRARVEVVDATRRD